MDIRQWLLQKTGWVICLMAIVSCGHSGSRSSEASPFFQSAVAHADSLALDNKTGQALRYIDSFYHSNDRKAAIADHYLKYVTRIRWFKDKNDFVSAGINADSALKLLLPYADDDAYNLLCAEAYLVKGDMLYYQGLFSNAYPYYFQGSRIAKSRTDSCYYNHYMARFDLRLAMISYRMEDYTTAISYYNQARTHLSVCTTGFDYLYEYQGALSNTGLSYKRAGDPDSALLYYKRCIDFLRDNLPAYPAHKTFIEKATGVVYGNMGDVYMQLGQLQLADSMYRTSIEINSRPGNYNQDALMTRVKLARLYLLQQKNTKAGELLQLIGNENQLAGNESKLLFLQTVADYRTAIGDGQYIAQNWKYFNTIRDSIEQEKKRFLNANVNNVFRLLQQEYEIGALRKQDKLKSILLAAAIVTLALAAALIILVIRNSRAAIRHAREVEQYNKEQRFALLALEQSNRENARLAKVLAHDLKNPIHAISSISTLMLRDSNRSKEDITLFGLIRTSVNNLLAVIDDILIARNQNGSIVLQKEPADLTELLQQSVKLLQFKAREKHQQVMLETHGPLFVSIDSDKIWRVLNNLLVNAIKFSPERTSIHITMLQDQENVVISVKDQGIGIPEAYAGKLFELNPDTQRKGTAGEETFGLGLYISKMIMEAHEGKIWFTPNPEGGSIFHIAFPLAAGINDASD
ncbi:tetratricopeptide repeat-containing sensor histidine kinase [Sediminibacterium ginsengisoli]|uniref:histidine kinase n=1 Tax=Sediminibacterium ginsengisoli TaxID=413434 RepID=A0A1T4P974_9BACT|nr:tetratricopeptide repeat-containing sensor histidine kinase [Sediminibacterium ginsengisoli]SJZ88083.1 Signal transduction histidine kinase [Sediminibacterium ginsengisoli]